MISLLMFFSLIASAYAAEPVPAQDGGVCAGLSWVTLEPGEKAFIEHGPDFVVLRFTTPGGPTERWWGVYSGNYPQVKGNSALLLERNGVVVHRATEDGTFRGYVAEKGNWREHFFGAVFTGSDADRTFFDRIDFGERGQRLCAANRN